MITTIHGDMINQDAEVKDDSINLLLTDPPYNISENGAKPVWKDKDGNDINGIHSQRFSESFDEDWDSVTHEEFILQMEDWAKFWFKKLKKGAAFAIFISDQYISYLWKIMEKEGFEPKRVWTWKKPAAVPFNRKVNPVSACEYILWGIKPGGKRTFNSDTTLNSRVDRYGTADKMSSILYKAVKDGMAAGESIDTIFDKAKEASKIMHKSRKETNGVIHAIVPNTITYSGGLGKNKIHPTEKPVELLEYFIELLSNKDDTVLDTFAGSGSTGRAAYNLNRKSILIERDKKMYQKMRERLFSNSIEQKLEDINQADQENVSSLDLDSLV